ncbi:MAG: hypothetical protein ABII75_09125, partial [Candidatus Omnitrophota bacterium]
KELTGEEPNIQKGADGALYSIELDDKGQYTARKLIGGKVASTGGGGGISNIDYGTAMIPSTPTEIVDRTGKRIKLTATQIDTISGFETALSQMGEVEDLLDITKTGPIAGRLSEVTRLADQADPNIVKLDAKLNSIKANYMKALSGAAVSESEVKRLAKFLPSINDTPTNIKIKMEEFRNNLETQKSSYFSALGAVQTQPSQSVAQTTDGNDVDSWLNSF